MDFSDAVVGGIPLVVLIIGLVQFLKELAAFRLRGNWSPASAHLMVGRRFLFGRSTWISVMQLWAGFRWWY